MSKGPPRRPNGRAERAARRAQQPMTWSGRGSVYSGRDRIGEIVERGGECRAISNDGRTLGTFASVKAAMRAFPPEAA